jgi:hypothetical protein
MKKVFIGILTSLAGLSMVAQYAVGIVLHLYTTFVAYKFSGVIAAVITFLTPPFSELYWAVTIWASTGDFMSDILIGLLLYLIIWIPIIISVSFAKALDD